MSVPLTLVTIPKPFDGHIGTIQNNAINSWKLLGPHCEIILIGDEAGTSEAAKRLGTRHVPEVERNEYGTPLLSSVLEKAQLASQRRLLCYVNADILLMSDFRRALERIDKWAFLFLRRPFLAVGRRWDLVVEEEWDFGANEWEARLRNRVEQYGTLRSDFAIDYFVFTRGLWGDIPPFAIGRTAWDNWLIYRARFLGAPVVNVTSTVVAVHQNHDYSHGGGKASVFEGPEAERNRQLAGGKLHYSFSLRDATWVLAQTFLRPAAGPTSLMRRKETEPMLFRERMHRWLGQTSSASLGASTNPKRIARG